MSNFWIISLIQSVMLVILSSYILSMCSKKKKKSKDPMKAVAPTPKGPSQESQRSKAPVVAAGVIPAMATAAVVTDQVKAGDEKKSSASAVDANSKQKDEKDDKPEDSFDNLKPKAAEAARAKDIRDEKVANKGDYKTFLPNSDFDNSIVDDKAKK